MNYEQILFAGFIAVVGWFITDALKRRSDLKSKQRELKIKSLENCYMILATTSNRPPSDEIAVKIENMISELQLYGNYEQIELIKKMVNDFKENSEVSYDDMLISLRNSIRTELELEDLGNKPVWWLRLKA